MSHCFFLVSVAGSTPQKIVFQLENEKCPKTCENFISFCKSTTNKSYKNTIFHRIIPGFMAQGGDYENGDGSGGESFVGGTLEDECFDVKHDGPYILSMANRGKNTAGSQFFITLGKASHLDGKHVAFGHVIEGKDVMKEIEKVETDEKDKPVNMQTVKIIESGIGNGEINGGSDSDSNSLSKEATDKQKSKKDAKKSKSGSKRDQKSKKRSSKYDSDSDDHESVSSSKNEIRHRKKHPKSKESRKHRRRKNSYSSDDRSDDEDSHRRKKRKHKSRKDKYDSEDSETSRDKKRRKKKRSKSRRSSRNDEYSSDNDSYSSSEENKKSRRHKDKKSKKRKHDKHDKPDKPEKSIVNNKQEENSFGKYGTIKESDLRTSTKVQRNFEIWLEEVKGIPQGTHVPKWEMAESFKEYAEDFNTATLPHDKYYDYDKWELVEYNKKKEEAENKKGARSDEFQYQEERKKQIEDKRKKELDLVRITMSKEKIEEMKRQSHLKAEMVNAYRVGDEKKRKKLQKRLEPDEK